MSKSILPEDNQIRCGYSVFSLPTDHPFTPACQAHDARFEEKATGEATQSRNLSDKQLLKDMLAIAAARKSFKLKAQAYLLWGIARTFGRLFW